MKKIALINHGCAKNLVDSELMLGLLAKNGWEITLDETLADTVIVNTCSFIHDAEAESVQTILQLIQDGKKVIVAGCLPQKHKEELKNAIPEIKGMIGTTDINELIKVLESTEYTSSISENPEYIYPEEIERQQITVGASSYIKIADGCNYACGYCVIPQLRGKCRSRKMENIIDEAKLLVSKGVSEIVLVAQDTTGYGIDLYGKPMLAELLRELNKIENLNWIRIMYAYPTQLSEELMDAIAQCEKAVKYVDIPLQHSHPKMLELMRRPVFDYRELVKQIRTKIPNVSIRTAFIVGYPGETEEMFEHLYDFVKEMKFDKMGVFQYSKEKTTISAKLKPQISAKVKKERWAKLMELQQKISREVNENYVGKTIPCIIESYTDDGFVICRSEHDAPEVDGYVYVKTDENIVPGDIEQIKITSANEYDLFGELAN